MTEISFKIQGYDVDRSGMMRLSALQRYLQQAAMTDSDKYGATYENMVKSGMVFIIIKMQYRIERMPRFGEEICIRSWSERIEGITFTRIYEVSVANEKYLEAVGHWALMDINSHRPLRPQQLEYKLPEMKLKEPVTLPRRIVIDSPVSAGKTRVTYGDTDINGHTNNCKYSDYLYDLLPLHRDIAPKTATMIYLGEAAEGDELEVVYERQENIFRAHIINITKGRTSLESEFVF